MAPKSAAFKPKPVGQAFKDKSKPADVRSSNISAAKGKKSKKSMKIRLQLINSIKNSVFNTKYSVEKKITSKINVVFNEIAIIITFGIIYSNLTIGSF